MRASRLLVPTVLALILAAPALASDRLLDLAIGDPARKDRHAPVMLDGVTDTATGDVITAAELAKRLAGVRLLLLGENHTSMEFHRVQARVIEALHEAGREVLIGLEMYPYTEQRYLDMWHERLLTEDGFVRLSRWYENWGYHWNYYRDIFLLARDEAIPLFAVNTPREVVNAVRRKGFENLTEEEAAHIPKDIDVDSEEHMTFFRAVFADETGPVHGQMSEEAWKGMLAAQATWDATMGYNAVKALERHGGKDAIMVVLVGSGHVAYGVGIERQVARWSDIRVASLIPVPVRTRTGDVGQARASYANFIWGIAPEIAPLYPSLGVSTRPVDHSLRQVIQVEKESAGGRAGFQVNDVILSMDGQPLRDRETMNRLLSEKRWGDSAVFEVRRDSETITLTAFFRRTLPEPPAPATPAGKPKTKGKTAG
jgi:uncharacterized iron-regulated protein